MDLTILSGMGGREAAKEILAINPKAKVLVSSGYSSDPIMANHKKYGFYGAMAKPYQLNELVKVLPNFWYRLINSIKGEVSEAFR